MQKDEEEDYDYRDIVVPDIDDDNQYRRPQQHLSGKFGYTAVGVSAVAVISQLIAPVLGIPPQIWAYFPFLWLLAGGIGIYGMFSDDRKSFDLFAIVTSILFGVPVIILSIQLLNSLHS